MDAWDCKSKGDKMQANQQWKLGVTEDLSMESTFTQIVYADSPLPGDCLTVVTAGPPAPSPNGTVAEYHEYSDEEGNLVTFLSNFGTSRADSGVVEYRGGSLYLSNHSVVVVSVKSSSGGELASSLVV